MSPYVVRGTSEHVWVCDECEATWRGGDLASTEFEQLHSFVAGTEGGDDWEDLEQIEAPGPEL